MAIATNIGPAEWRNEDDAAIATAIDVLQKQAEQQKRKRGKR